MADGLLGAGLVRELAATLGVTPTKQWGQNFVHDANTVTRIVKEAGVGPHDVVLEVGPGLGSLTLALLPVVSHVVVVEIDPRLATGLPATVARLQPQHAERLSVVQADAMQVTELPVPPTALVANLPYNVAVPVVLTLLARFPSIARCLVMVQLEVAERLSARPGSKVYGTPSVKAAWYGETSLVGKVPPSVFWPVPNVDSGLVSLVRREPPVADVSREAVFACVDAAFAQRRKGLRSALAGWAGSAAEAEAVLAEAGIAPLTRGEQLSVADFCRVAAARQRRLSA